MGSLLLVNHHVLILNMKSLFILRTPVNFPSDTSFQVIPDPQG